MSYIDFEYAAAGVEGTKRLLTILQPSGDTADDHPHFDDTLAIAERLVNAELERAGYDTPLAEVTDAALKNAVLGILIGKLTESKSNREEWMGLLEKSGLDYIKRIGDGEITIEGVPEEEEPAPSAAISGSAPEDPIFDIGNPFATANEVFGSLDLRGMRRR